jgi:hypothetical protein
LLAVVAVQDVGLVVLVATGFPLASDGKLPLDTKLELPLAAAAFEPESRDLADGQAGPLESFAAVEPPDHFGTFGLRVSFCVARANSAAEGRASLR